MAHICDTFAAISTHFQPLINEKTLISFNSVPKGFCSPFSLGIKMQYIYHEDYARSSSEEIW
jgi:hypothetical protein